MTIIEDGLIKLQPYVLQDTSFALCTRITELRLRYQMLAEKKRMTIFDCIL